MNQHYADILALSPTPPKWFDEHAVPRFYDFRTGHAANIYASECALVRIRCQSCGHEFDVCFTQSSMDRIRYRMVHGKDEPTIADDIRSNALGYGDPPNVDCCPAGPTMSSDTIRVLQYWRRDDFAWERVPELEIEFPEESE